MLQIKNVNLNVGNTTLLSNINLTLEQGKIYGVLGPNGAGKTTLFKSAGTDRLFGKNPLGWATRFQ